MVLALVLFLLPLFKVIKGQFRKPATEDAG